MHQNIVTTKMIMGITDRHAQIVEMSQQRDFLSVEELAEYLQLTTQTIHDGKINDPTKVFCDRKPHGVIVTNFQQSGVELVFCGANGAK